MLQCPAISTSEVLPCQTAGMVFSVCSGCFYSALIFLFTSTLQTFYLNVDILWFTKHCSPITLLQSTLFCYYLALLFPEHSSSGPNKQWSSRTNRVKEIKLELNSESLIGLELPHADKWHKLDIFANFCSIRIYSIKLLFFLCLIQNDISFRFKRIQVFDSLMTKTLTFALTLTLKTTILHLFRHFS